MNLRITMTLSVPIDPKDYNFTDGDLNDMREIDIAEDILELETRNGWNELSDRLAWAPETELSLQITGDGAPRLGCSEEVLASGIVPKPSEDRGETP